MTSPNALLSHPLDAFGELRPTRSSEKDFQPIARAYVEVTRTAKEQGLLRRAHGFYAAVGAGIVVALAGAIAGSILLGDSWFQLIIAAVLGIIFTRIAFLAHEAAHRQILSTGPANDRLARVLAGSIGMSYSWWDSKHTRHHANPNRVGKDPELEGLNLHLHSFRHLFSREPVRGRWIELSIIAARFALLLTPVFLFLPVGMAFAFLGVQFAVFGVYMGASFAPNHKGMPVIAASAKLGFFSKQVRTSRNIRGRWWATSLMGGLNYQVEHHQFPSMARPHLAKASKTVREFCAEHRVPYTETSLWRSYGIVIEYLNRVGLSGRDPFECPVSAQYGRAR